MGGPRGSEDAQILVEPIGHFIPVPQRIRRRIDAPKACGAGSRREIIEIIIKDSPEPPETVLRPSPFPKATDRIRVPGFSPVAVP